MDNGADGSDHDARLPHGTYGILLARLGHAFDDVGLLQQSLTHRSHVNESTAAPTEHNERLEFLGDAVVDLAVGHHLMESLPVAREGQLSKLRAMVVNESSLARAAEQLGLGEHLLLGRGEEQTGGRHKASILSDALEALIGAVYLDAGYEQADRVVRRLLGPLVEQAVAGELDRDHKTRLQELAQADLQQVPRYEVTSDRGPDHAKVFEVAVHLGDQELARGSGGSKKEAEQRAAELALARLARR